jgi:rhodanese-related sulfurtransferase
MEDILAEDLAKIISEKTEIQLLDVRELIEFHTFNIGGVHIPLGNLPQVLEDEDLNFNLEEPVIVVCQHGIRSKTAKVLLQNAGFKKTKNLIGGLVKFQRIS